MSIIAECSACGRRYQAPVSMAGKRVRCKQCGNIFQLPGGEISPADAELDALDELEKSIHALDATLTQTDVPSEANAESSETLEQVSVTPLQAGRLNVRFNFPGAKTVDRLLPVILTVGGLLWLATECFKRDDTAKPWFVGVRLAVAVLCYSMAIWPLSLAMLRRAAKRLGYQMPRHDRWRAFSTYLPAFALGYVMWIAGGGWPGALILGCLAGIAVSTFALWVLFRLHPEEIALSAVYAAAGFFCGLLIVGTVVWTLNALLANVLISIQKPDLLPGSPFGQGFATTWISEEQKRAIIAARARQPTRPRPAPPHLAEPSTQPLPPQPTSPLIRSIQNTGIEGAFDAVVYPLIESPFLAVVRPSGGDSAMIELWNSQTWTPLGSATFRNTAEPVGNRYVLSSDGNHLARIATFPRLSAQVWSFSENRISKIIYLDQTWGTPELVGFLQDQRLLIRWQKELACALEIIDLVTGPSGSLVQIPYFERTGCVLAVSPDGTLAAITAKADGLPTLLIYDLRQGIRELSKKAIESLDPRWRVEPTGMAFSPDCSNLAILFEEQGNGLLLNYALDPTKGTLSQTAEHVYPAGPMPGSQLRRPGCSALAWLPDGQAWLIYGRGIFELQTGQLVADLLLSDIDSYRLLKPDVLQVVSNAAGQRQIVVFKLDMPKISTLIR